MDRGRPPATDFWSFVRAVGGQWFTAMSGPATVPFAFTALFVDGSGLKILFGALSVTCAVFSSYWVWRTERIKRLRVERTDINAVTELGRLRTKGVQLQNRPAPTDIEAYEDDVLTFRGEALAIMNDIASESDIAWFRDLSTFDIRLHSADRRYRDARNAVIEMLDRMDKISRRIESHYWGRTSDSTD